MLRLVVKRAKGREGAAIYMTMGDATCARVPPQAGLGTLCVLLGQIGYSLCPLGQDWAQYVSSEA